MRFSCLASIRAWVQSPVPDNPDVVVQEVEAEKS